MDLINKKHIKILSRLLFTFLLVLILLHTGYRAQIKADFVQPAIENVLVKRGETITKKFSYKNTSNDRITYKTEIARINPENNQLSPSDEIYVKVPPQFKSFSLNHNEQIDIEYTITIPALISNGSYFNVISVINNSDGDNVSVSSGIGIIVAMHVEDDTNSMVKSIKEKTSTKVTINSMGDLINPTKITWEFQNNSNYVLKPSLTILSKDSATAIAPEKFYQSDSSGKDSFTSYPGKTITKQITIPLWNIKNFFKTYNFYFETVTSGIRTDNKVEINLMNNNALKLTGIIAAGLFLIFALIILPYRIYQKGIIKGQRKF